MNPNTYGKGRMAAAKASSSGIGSWTSAIFNAPVHSAIAFLFVLFAASSVAGMAALASPEISLAVEPSPQVAMAHAPVRLLAFNGRVLGDSTNIRVGQLVYTVGNKTVYLVASNGVYGFTDAKTFYAWGYSTSAVLPENAAEQNLPVLGNVPLPQPGCTSPLAQITGNCIGASVISSIRTGQLVYDASGGLTIYLVGSNVLYPFSNASSYYSWYSNFNNILKANSAELALPISSTFVPAKQSGCNSPLDQINGVCKTVAVTIRVGQLVYNPVTKTVYFVGANGLYGFPDVETFSSWGFTFSQISLENSAELALNQIGVVPMHNLACNSPLDQINNTCGNTAKPTIISINPSQGAPGQTVTIKILGSGLLATSNLSGNGLPVSVNGLQLLSSKAVSDSEIDATYSIGQNAALTTTQIGAGGSNTLPFTVTNVVNQQVLIMTLDPAAPVSTTIAPGSVDVPVATFRFSAIGGDVSVGISGADAMGPNAQGGASANVGCNFTNVKLFDASTQVQIGSTIPNLAVVSGVCQGAFSNVQFTVPNNTSKSFIIKVSIPASAAPGSFTFGLGGYSTSAAAFTGGTQVGNTMTVGSTVSGGAHAVGTNVTDSTGAMYLIVNGQRRPYSSAAAFLSYGFNSYASIVPANSSDLALPVGAFILPADGNVYCSTSTFDAGSCYLMTGGQKAAFASAQIFSGLGFSQSRIIVADVSAAPSAATIASASEAHRPGTLVNISGTVYLVGPGPTLLGIPDLVTFNSWGWLFAQTLPGNAADSALPQGGLVAIRAPGQLTPVVLSSPAFSVYDYNNDGKVDISDFNILFGVVNKVAGYSCPTGKTCDINADGVLDINDLIAFQKMFNLGTSTGASLPVLSKNSAFSNQTVSPNQAVHIGSYTIQAPSTEGARVTGLSLTFAANTSGAADPTTALANLYLVTPQGNTTSVKPSAGGNFAVNFTIPVNQVVVVDVYADVSSASGYIQTVLSAWGVGATSNQSFNLTPQLGQVVNILSSSQPLTVSLSPVSLLSQYLVGNSPNQPIATYNIVGNPTAGATIQEMDFSIVGTTAMPVSAIAVNGVKAPVTGSTVIVGGLNIAVPANNSGVNVTASADLSAVGANGVPSNTSFSLRLDKIKYFTGGGVSQSVSPGTISNQMTLVGTTPILSLSSSGASLTAGQVKLGSVIVSAGASGNMILNQLPVTITLSGGVNISGNAIVVDEATNQTITTTDSGLCNGMQGSSGASCADVINFGSGNSGRIISAGSSKTFDILFVAGGSGFGTIVLKLGPAANFLWTDVTGNASNITGSLIPNYPTNSVSVSGTLSGAGSNFTIPSFTAPLLTQKTVGSPLSFSVTATDAQGGPLTVKVDWGDGSPVDWLGQTASPNVPVVFSQFSHIYQQAGNYNVTLTVINSGTALSTYQTRSVTIVSGSLTVTPSPLNFSATVSGSNPAARQLTLSGVTGQWNATPSPSGTWLRVNGAAGGATGVIGSTPLAVSIDQTGLPAGTYSGNIIISSYDTPARFTSVIIQVTLTLTASNLQITTSALPTATTGQPYSTQIQGSGGIAPYTFMTMSTTYPAGCCVLGLNGLGNSSPNSSPTVTFNTQSSPTIVNTITAGTYSWTIQLTDGAGNTVTKNISLVINNPAPSFSQYDYNNDGKVDYGDLRILGFVVNNVPGYSSCPAGKNCDVNGDGKIDINDLISFAQTNGLSLGSAQYDYNNDGKVDYGDLRILNFVVTNAPGYSSCPAGKNCDVNGDGKLDINDLTSFAQVNGLVLGNAQYDYNNDGKYNSADYAILSAVVNNTQACPAGRNCDVNGDGLTNSSDLTAYAQMFAIVP